MQVIEYQQSGRVKQRSLPIPKIHDNDILVKVTFSGICGTDLHIISGEAPAADKVVPGHEFSGTVTDIGSHASKIKAGDSINSGHHPYITAHVLPAPGCLIL